MKNLCSFAFGYLRFAPVVKSVVD